MISIQTQQGECSCSHVPEADESDLVVPLELGRRRPGKRVRLRLVRRGRGSGRLLRGLERHDWSKSDRGRGVWEKCGGECVGDGR